MDLCMLVILTMLILSTLLQTHPHLWKLGASLIFLCCAYLLLSEAHYHYNSKAVVIMLVASVSTAIIIAYLTHHYKVHNFSLKFPYLLLFLSAMLLIFLSQDFSTYCSLYEEWFWNNSPQTYDILFETYVVLTLLIVFLILMWTSL